jgi:hypothetical protein
MSSKRYVDNKWNKMIKLSRSKDYTRVLRSSKRAVRSGHAAAPQEQVKSLVHPDAFDPVRIIQ